MKKGPECTAPNAQRILLTGRLIKSMNDIGSLSALLPEILKPENEVMVREIIRGLMGKMGMEDVVSTIREVREEIATLLKLIDQSENPEINPDSEPIAEVPHPPQAPASVPTPASVIPRGKYVRRKKSPCMKTDPTADPELISASGLPKEFQDAVFTDIIGIISTRYGSLELIPVKGDKLIIKLSINTQMHALTISINIREIGINLGSLLKTIVENHQTPDMGLRGTLIEDMRS